MLPDEPVEVPLDDEPLPLVLPLEDPELAARRRERLRRPRVLPLSLAALREESPAVLGAPEAPIPFGALTAAELELLFVPVAEPDPDADGSGCVVGAPAPVAPAPLPFVGRPTLPAPPVPPVPPAPPVVVCAPAAATSPTLSTVTPSAARTRLVIEHLPDIWPPAV